MLNDGVPKHRLDIIEYFWSGYTAKYTDFHARRTALFMGLHKRLGEKSGVRDFAPEVFDIVARCLLTDPKRPSYAPPAAAP